jgi:RNA polymerase sigma factor (sigma-70 family)
VSALLRSVRSNDFDRLYRRHAVSVYRYAYAVLGNHADAEDVTQQTFLNAYRSIAQGTKPRKAENWLLTIAHNEVRRHFRSAKAKVQEVELDEELERPAPERSEPSLADVLRALQHLPPAQRSALVMREFEGRSYAEIARIMNVTQSALETQVFRARRALAEQLEGGLTCHEAEQAISRRLDGRLPRRVARRLKAHLHECPVCERFAAVQKRQRSLLRGLSVMPIPASLFLFRGEQAAASVGLGAAVGGSSAAVGTGIAAKAAAVTAAAAVAGGVGYGVTAGPPSLAKAGAPVAKTKAVAQPRPARHTAARVRPARVERAAAIPIASRQRKAVMMRSAKPAPSARQAAKARQAVKKAALAAAKIERAATKGVRPVKARPVKTPSPKHSAARKPRPQPQRAKQKLRRVKAAHVPPGAAQPKQPGGRPPAGSNPGGQTPHGNPGGPPLRPKPEDGGQKKQ